MADPKKYRDEADRLRREADETPDLHYKRLLRQLADLYERLARHAVKGREDPENC